MVFVLFCFFIRFFMEDMFRNNKIQATLEGMSAATDNAGKIYLPINWFTNAITKTGILDILLLSGVSILLFTVVFSIVGSSYRSINSKLKSHAAAKNYKMTKQKKTGVIHALVFKEWKRMTGSSLYMTNGAMGMVFAIILGGAALVLGPDKINELVVKAIPLGPSVLQPAIPFVVYFFVGMFSTPTSSPSLEGKNYWIVQSLPIYKKTLYQAKMLFNMYLSVPFMEFGILCLCIGTRTPVIDTVLYLILGFVMCSFSTAWGCVCGIKHMRLDWENEIEVIKQGTGVVIYLLPNMFVSMILMVLVVFLGMAVEHSLVAALFILIYGLLASLSYRKVMTLSK